MNAKNVIGILLVTNLALLGGVVYLSKNRPAAKAQVETTAPVQTKNGLRPVPKRTTEFSTNSAGSTKFDWHAVESADYKEYIANLRAIGCPEETIRDIIIADVNKLFESRKKAAKSSKKFEFWKSGNMFAGMMDEEKIKQNQEMAKEKKALLKELLGIEPEEKADLAAVVNPLQGMLDFLPDEKQSKVVNILQEYQAKAMKLMKGGAPDAEDMKSMLKTQKEMEGQLAKVLTPEELEDYQLRLSQTSMMMRMQLGPFEPSEQEFRELFKVRKAFDDEFGWGGSGVTDKADRDRMAIAKKETEAQMKQLLGDTRFAEYERSQDFKYQNLVKIGDRNGLQRDSVNQVYDMDKISNETIKKLRDDKTMDAAKREEAIKQIRDETQTSIKGVLGEKAFDSYTNRSGRFGQ